MSSTIFFSSSLESQFENDGIVRVPLLNNAEVESLLHVYEDISDGISDKKFHSTMFIGNPDYRKRTNDEIRKVILGKVNSVVSGYKMLFANFIVKESSAETKVGIHQDWNFTSPDFVSINIWIPLIDIDEKTGLFHALLNSHKTFQNIRYTPYDDNAYSKLRNFIYENSTSFLVKAGEAVIYHGGLVHFSDPNLSGRSRVAVGAAMIPNRAPNLHYFKRNGQKDKLEVYEVNETFYNSFNFFEEPKGVKKIKEIISGTGMPSITELVQQKYG